ncbi:MAG: hypothetical protein AB1656_08505 [Candidatus Omnitrophota bacterium]
MSRSSWFYLIIIPLGFVFAAPSRAEEAFLLQNKFHKGEVCYLVYAVTQEGAVTMNKLTADGKPSSEKEQLPIQGGLQSVMRFETLNVDNQGEAVVQAEFLKMEMNDPMLGGGKAIDLISDWGMGEEKIKIKINASGSVFHYLQEPNQQKMKLQGMSDAGQSTTQQNPYLRFPEKAIPIGYSWVERKTVPFTAASKEMVVDSTYTLDSVYRRENETIARISTQTSMMNENVQVDSAQSGQNTGLVKLQFQFKEYSSKGQGTLEFNLDKGRIESMKTESNMVIDLSGKTNINEAELPSEFAMKFKINAFVNVDENKPAD